MYLQAMAGAIAADGVASWFVVHTDTPLGDERYRLLAEGLEREATTREAPAREVLAGQEVGHLAVPPGLPLYRPAFDAIEESGAQAVVLLLEARASHCGTPPRPTERS